MNIAEVMLCSDCILLGVSWFSRHITDDVDSDYLIEVVSAGLLYCKVTLIPFIMNKCFGWMYFENM